MISTTTDQVKKENCTFDLRNENSVTIESTEIHTSSIRSLVDIRRFIREILSTGYYSNKTLQFQQQAYNLFLNIESRSAPNTSPSVEMILQCSNAEYLHFRIGIAIKVEAFKWVSPV